jgi:high-affinity iron transporter
VLLGALAAPARAADDTTASLLSDFSAQYQRAVVAHDEVLAARLRTETRLLSAAEGTPDLARLATTLRATSDPLQPWPRAGKVDALVARAGVRDVAAAPARPYSAVRSALDGALAAERAGDERDADLRALRAYALTHTLRRRLGAGAAELDAAFWSADRKQPGVLTALDRRAGLEDASARARDRLAVAEQTLGDVQVSRGTVVADAAIIVFREGLEAVLILAAITASFVGARRRLRRPVLLGGLAGVAATAVTWGVAQLVVSQLGTGGLRLEAITGLLAIAVLLVVTNWFFHRVYWSQWIARFNRRRKRLERFDKVGFLSGQAIGLGILGLTSVYREGFETVLFLQNLEVSAGAAACLLGAAIGLAGVLAIGGVTFVAQRKLPYRRMLIATGVLIALVLAVMTGTTVHVMQGLGWLPSTPAGLTVPLWANSWLGIYATWEGLAAQVGALVFVIGSYVVARELQSPQRRARHRGRWQTPPTSASPTPSVNAQSARSASTSRPGG